jgi:hypothetical protein
MTIPAGYLTTVRNIKPILEDMQRAGVPPRFTYDFLKQLGHGSSANRPVIGVLKALGFLTDTGEPTDRYRRFKDPAHSRRVMAEALREAYADVFTVDQQANERTTNDLKGIFARLSDKGDAVNMKMASTFKTLAELADFQAPPLSVGESPAMAEAEGPADTTSPPVFHRETREGALVVHHDVHVHLPVTTDIAVYNAIFRSLRENLQ